MVLEGGTWSASWRSKPDIGFSMLLRQLPRSSPIVNYIFCNVYGNLSAVRIACCKEKLKYR